MKLQKERIIAKALELLDEEGLEGVTQRKLAKSMDVVASALYWHFKNRTALIDEMAEAILQSEFATFESRKNDERWQDWLTTTMQRMRHAMLSRRDGARIVAGAHPYPAITLATIAETSMESLVSAGLSIREARLISLTAINFTFGHTIEEQDSPNPSDFQDPNFQTFMKDFKKKYPLMTAGIKEASDSKRTADDEFTDALRLIIG